MLYSIKYYDKCLPIHYYVQCARCMLYGALRTHKSALTYSVYAERKYITCMCVGFVVVIAEIRFCLVVLKTCCICSKVTTAVLCCWLLTRFSVAYAKIINFIFQSWFFFCVFVISYRESHVIDDYVALT